MCGTNMTETWISGVCGNLGVWATLNPKHPKPYSFLLHFLALSRAKPKERQQPGTIRCLATDEGHVIASVCWALEFGGFRAIITKITRKTWNIPIITTITAMTLLLLLLLLLFRVWDFGFRALGSGLRSGECIGLSV